MRRSRRDASSIGPSSATRRSSASGACRRRPAARCACTSSNGGTRLRTPTGTMHGSYFCVAEDGEKFDVDIPMFVLDALSGDVDSKRTLH